MREYYKEKLANLREITRSISLLLITLLSGVTYLFVNILLNEFKMIEFILLSFGYIISILIFIFLIKLYKYMFELTEKIKEIK
jgi:uncharacterized membrane protein YbhN (UPF0104 family)